MSDKFRFQPGWSTPITVDYRKPSFIAWLLGARDAPRSCLARRQDRCPGRNECHDCAWQSQPDR